MRKLHKAEMLEFNQYTHGLEIPPYFLGLFLGDGCSTNGGISITSADIEIINEIKDYCNTNSLKN